MLGIDLDRPITYKYSSLRFFKENEYHVTRFCEDDVLLLVYDGILRFTEDGRQYAIHPGEYHIQKHNSTQAGEIASDSPKYLYVHFFADWTDTRTALSPNGCFDCMKLKPVMEELDFLAHNNAPYILQTAKFYELLSNLLQREPTDSPAHKIADYISREYPNPISLEKICREFHFSKNHVINLFKKTFGMTPVTYTNVLRLNKAKYLIEVTSDSLENIAAQCGFRNYSHFYRLFYRENKMSPDKWREQKRIGTI